MSIENYKWSKLPDIGKLSRLSLQHFMNGFCWILSVVIETLGELLCEDHGNVKCKSGRILTFLVNFTGGPLCGDNKYDKISAAPGPICREHRAGLTCRNKTKI